MTQATHILRQQRGFTLVEMAVVMVILGLMLGGLLMPFSMQLDQKNYTDTKRQLEEAKEALIGYAMSHSAVDGKPYFPCPDTNGDGIEESRDDGNGTPNEPTDYDCPSQEGRLPWNTLGLNRGDAWSNLIRYRIHPTFSNSGTGFTLTSTANFRICEDSACATVIATGVPFVLISHGKNGYGARNSSNAILAVPANISADELQNINGRNNPTVANPNVADTADTVDVDFVIRFFSTDFDDAVVWGSTNLLVSRMVQAGRLP